MNREEKQIVSATTIRDDVSKDKLVCIFEVHHLMSCIFNKLSYYLNYSSFRFTLILQHCRCFLKGFIQAVVETSSLHVLLVQHQQYALMW